MLRKPPDVTDVETQQTNPGGDGRPRINHFLAPVLVLEALVLLCLAVLAYFLRFTDEFPVFERVIFCDDATIKYPFDNSSHAIFEVHSEVLFAICFVLPPVLIVVGEFGMWIFSNKPRKVIRAHCSTCSISLTARRLLRFIGTFLLGSFCTSIITDAIKLMAGRPRPYFLSVCDPQGFLCSLSNNKILNGTAACSNSFNQYARDARMSFPSFHAALASYTAGYIMIYLHSILRMHGTYALRPLLVLLIGGMCCMAGFSCLMTYRNHWEDVVAGFVLGSVIAVYFAVFVMNLFKEHSSKHRPENYFPQSDDRSRFCRWFLVPRISFGKNMPRNYGVYSNGQVDKGPLEPNPAFQQDLHRRIENFGRKNMKSQPQQFLHDEGPQPVSRSYEELNAVGAVEHGVPCGENTNE